MCAELHRAVTITLCARQVELFRSIFIFVLKKISHFFSRNKTHIAKRDQVQHEVPYNNNEKKNQPHGLVIAMIHFIIVNSWFLPFFTTDIRHCKKNYIAKFYNFSRVLSFFAKYYVFVCTIFESFFIKFCSFFCRTLHFLQ